MVIVCAWTYCTTKSTPDSWQSQTWILLTNVCQKSLETESGDKRQYRKYCSKNRSSNLHQLSSSLATFKIELWSTLRYKTMFSKADNYMNEGCFSLLLCVVNIHVLVIYTCISFILLYILWNTEAVILVKILLDATFSGIPLTESFLRERIHSKNLYENHL